MAQLIEPAGLGGFALAAPVAQGAPAVPGAGGVAQHLGLGAGHLQRAHQDIEQRRQALHVLLHGARAIDEQRQRHIGARRAVRQAEQAPLGRCSHQLRQAPPVYVAAFLPAVPAVYSRAGQQGLQAARPLRWADGALAHRRVQRGAQVLQLRGAHQVLRGHFFVVMRGENAVAGRRLRSAFARQQGAGPATVLAGLKVHPDLQPGVFVVGLVGGGVFVLCGLGLSALAQRSHDGGNGQRVLGVRGLVVAAAAQGGQGVADVRRQPKAGGLKHVLQRLVHRLAGHARAAHLRHG